MRKLKNAELQRLSQDQYHESSKNNIIIVLDNIRSCNNIGSFFRTADALLTEAIYLCGYTAIPPNKEIHKTALDAENIVSWRYFENTIDALDVLKGKGYKIYAIEQVENSTLLTDFIPGKGEKLALIFGNEVSGVQQEVIDACDGAIEIPQYGTKHSFNVSVTGGIVLWDILCKMKKEGD